MRVQGVLAALLTEHVQVFGCQPSPPLCEAVKGALDCGLTVSDFWMCFDSVATEFQAGTDFMPEGGADAEIIRRLRGLYRKKVREKQDGG